MEENVQSRVRMNLALTAKGTGQWNLTSEFSTVSESAENLSAAIDAVRKIMKEKNIPEAGKESK